MRPGLNVRWSGQGGRPESTLFAQSASVKLRQTPGAAMIKFRPSLVCIVIALGLAEVSAEDNVAPPSPPTQSLQQIKLGLAKRFEQVENLTIKYLATETIVYGDPPRDVTQPLIPNGKGRGDMSFLGDKELMFPWLLHEHRLHKGNKRYSHCIYPVLGVFSNAAPAPTFKALEAVTLSD
jgi:hypothetical protein